MSKQTEGWRVAIAILLVGSAVLFVVGTRLERSAESREHRATTEVANPESDESAEQREAESADRESGGERLFGINPDSAPAVAAGAAVSLLLALAIWLWRTRLLLGAVALLGLAFAGLDLREVAHQVDKSRTSLIVIAALLAVMHLGVSVLAAVGFRSRPRKAPG